MRRTLRPDVTTGGSDAAESRAGVVSLETIREAFPALRRTRSSHAVGYFDAPGGTQVPAVVADAVTEQLLGHNANAHWAYATSRELDEMLAGAREAMADYVGGVPEEVVFGPNMTGLSFRLAHAFGRRFGPRDEVLVTELDHEANVAPWRSLQEESGVRVRSVPMVPETGDLDWDAFESLVSRRTRLLAVTAASNALGTIVNLPRVAALARSVGALLVVDAVHLAPHERLDVETLGCDFLACSAYKFYGPHVGVLWGRHDLLNDIRPPRLPPAPNLPPESWETGTLNHEGIAGTAAAVGFLASLAPGNDRAERLDAAFSELSRRGNALVSRLWQALDAVPGVRLFGPPPGTPRTPTLSFTIDGTHPAEAAALLSDEWGLYLSHGNFYAPEVTHRLGVGRGGLLRAGCACYTSRAEIDRLAEAIEWLVAAS